MTLWKAMYISSTFPYNAVRIRRKSWRWGYVQYTGGSLWHHRKDTDRTWEQYRPSDEEFYAEDWEVVGTTRIPCVKFIPSRLHTR